MCLKFAAFCADSGDQLIEIHRSQALRIQWLRDGCSAATHLGDQEQLAAAEYNLGTVLVAQDHCEEAKPLIRRALDFYKNDPDKSHSIAALNALGLVEAIRINRLSRRRSCRPKIA